MGKAPASSYGETRRFMIPYAGEMLPRHSAASGAVYPIVRQSDAACTGLSAEPAMQMARSFILSDGQIATVDDYTRQGHPALGLVTQPICSQEES